MFLYSLAGIGAASGVAGCASESAAVAVVDVVPGLQEKSARAMVIAGKNDSFTYYWFDQNWCYKDSNYKQPALLPWSGNPNTGILKHVLIPDIHYICNMRFCFSGLMCVAIATQLSACKTPAIAGGSNTAAGNSTQETAATAGAATDTAGTAKPATRNPGIISVIVNATAQGHDVTWAIGSVSVSPGRFKHNFAGAMPGYLRAYFTDDEGHKLDSNLFEHPLRTRAESPNDQGGYTNTISNDATGAAYLRANNNSAITSLHIYSADNKKLASFNLTEYLKK